MASRFHSDEFSGSWDNANANDGSYTNTTNTNTSVSEGGDDDQDFDYYESGTRSHNMIVVAVLIGLIIFLCLILTFVTLPPLYACIRRKMPVSQRRIDRRYATIEGWLISKNVKPHDAVCDGVKKYYGVRLARPQTNEVLICQPVSSNIIHTELQLPLPLPLASPDSTSTSLTIAASTEDSPAEPSPTPTTDEEASPSSSPITEPKEGVVTRESTKVTIDENGADADGTSNSCCSNPTSHSQDTPECPICMEVFEVGQCVSWSASTKCEHVFHYECIKEWLLRRIGCPYCRETFLPVDRQRGRLPSKVLEHMAKERAQRASFTYYCQVDGLVTLQALKHKKEKMSVNDNDGNDDIDDDDGDVSLKTRPRLARRFLTRWRGGTTRRQRRRQLRRELQANGNETGLEILASTTTPRQEAIETMPALVASPLRANSTLMEDNDDNDNDHDESPEEWNDAVSETRVRRQLEFGDANQTSPYASSENAANNDLEEGRMILLQEDQSKPSDSNTVHGQSAENDNGDCNSLGSSGTIVFETEQGGNDDDDDDDTERVASGQDGIQSLDTSCDMEVGMAVIEELDMVFHVY